MKLRKHPSRFGLAVGASLFRFPSVSHKFIETLTIALCFLGGFSPETWAQPSGASAFPLFAARSESEAAPRSFARAQFFEAPAEAEGASLAPMPAAGGPDAFGYEFIDSDSPGGPTFQWFDISGLGTPLNLADDGFANVSLPFGFSFYGATKNSVIISNNGYLTFGSDGSDRNNDEIPDPNSPNDIIAPFWDNLQSTGGNVYHYYDSANGRFIVQYHNVTGHGDPDTHTFQVILQTNGQILFQYLTLGETLDRCTVGIENASGSTGLQVVADDDYLHNNLAIRFATPNPLPTITSAAPNAGNRLQTLNVVLTGTGYATGVTSVSFGAGITVNSTTINSATQLTANITITPAAATGPRNVQVTNAAPGGGTATLTNGFTVNNPLPTLTGAAPNTGALGQTMDVVLTGTNFISGVSVPSFGAGITVNATTVTSSSQITANITIGTGATTGPRDVTVTNPAPGGGTATLTNGFAINNSVPTITNAAPNSGTRTQTLNVVLTGTNFVNGVTTASFGNDVTVNSAVANSATQITANLTIGATAATGARDIVVTNPAPGGGSATLTSGFTITNPAPTLTSVTPNLAGREQTLDITLTGSGFLSGVSVANFGANITVNSATVNPAGTELIANITVAGNAALGARDVSVTNPAPGGGTATLAGSFTINNPVPTLTSVNPANANQGQTLDVVLTGSGFLSGATTVDFGANVTINSTTINSATQLTANITVGAAATLGARNVSVTNPAPGGGTATLTNGFNIGLAAPTLTSIAPTSGERLATLDVVFTGTNFVNGATTVNFGADITVNSLTVNSATSLTANITIASSAVLGLRDVSVTNPAPGGGTATLTNGFTVLNPSPTLTSLAPTSGNRGATLDVILTGANFVSGSTVNFGANITVNSTTINSSTQITANISIATIAATGAREVTITNAAPGGGASTLAGGFTVTNPLPTFTSLNPTSALQGQTLNVVLSGANFIAGASTVDFGGDVTINSTTVNSATQITANISVAPNAVVGSRDVSITNPAPGGGSATLTNGFTIQYNAPTLTNVVPNNGNRVQTLDVTLTGSNFIAGVTTVDFGADIAINSVTVNSATSLTANITIAETAITGLRNVSVTNPAPGGGTATLNNGFAVNNPAPVLSIVDPNVGSRSETMDVLLTGENFLNGITSVSFGSGITVNALTINSATELSANITIASNATLGFRNVAVTNPAPGGGTATFVNAFSVVNPTPALTNVAPALGLQNQTLDVVLTGTGFLSGITSVNFGADVTINATTINSLTQLTANITIGANAAVGARDVSVTNIAPGGGTATLAGSFTVGYNAPALTSIAPINANRLQTLDVVFTGTNFINAVTTVDFGAEVTINSVTVNSATQLTANIFIAGSAALGVRNVSVTNPTPAGGTATLPNAFTIGNPAPSLTNLAPAVGEREQTLDVVLTGGNFVDGLTSVNFGAGITVNTTTINSATQLTANITIASTATTGPRTVSVTNAAPGGGTATFVNGFNVHNAAPTLTNVAPASVSRGQTLDVVLTGSHFYTDASSVDFGPDITINATTINSLTQITANITVGVNAALGARDVSVTNAAPGGGTATLTNGLSIEFPTITITNVAPNNGNRLQTLDVVVTGSNFLAGATSVSFGNDITVNSTTVNSATELTANITIAAIAASGLRDVTVTNPAPGGGSATLTNGFTVNNPLPALTSAIPNAGNRLQTLDVVLTGENFIEGVTSVSFGNDISINTTTVNSATQLAANITIGVNAALGARDVVVTNAAPNGGSATLANGFTVNNPAPLLTSVNPTLGLQGQTLNVVLTGDNFIDGVSSVSFGNDITINSTTVNSATQITANIAIAANATLGARDVIVTNAGPNGGIATLAGGFTVGFPTLTLTSINPVIGNRLQTLDVVMTGTNFVNGATTANFGADITVNSSTVTSSTQLTANITITGTAATGPRAVSVTNPDPGGSTATLNNSFIVNNPTPQVTSITPNSGSRGETLDIALVGDNFISGLTTASFGADITVNALTVIDAANMTANISIAANATLGARTVVITNPTPGGGSVTFVNGFTVANPTPALLSIAPTLGLQGQTLDVVLNGSGFIDGLSSVSFGNEITVNTTTVNNGAQITANITIDPTATVGTHDVSVTNPAPGGGTATLNAAFTIGYNAPTLTSLAPASALQGQTLNVILTGNNFVDGVSSVSFGNGITINSTTINSATQITANISIAANATPGGRDVSVTNSAPGGGTATLANGFNVGQPTLTLTSLNPVAANRLQTLDVTMTGTDFIIGTTTASFGPDILVNSVTVTSATQLTANITITGTAATGPRAVSVTNPDPGGSTATLNNSFIVNNPTPQVTSITPNSGSRGETLDIALVGDNFISGLTTASFGADITVNALTVIDAANMTANISIAANATLGARTVVITNPTPGGGSVTFVNGFTVANPTPALLSIAPTLGLQGQTLDVVLNGSGFIDGLSSVSFGNEITVNTTTVNNGAQITANITIDPTATVGTHDVSVTNPAPGGGTATLNAAFTIGYNAPTLTSLAPSIGSRLQNMNVVLTGSNFINGVTTVDFGADVTINSVTANSATQLTANITIAANAALGSRNVSVTNPTPAGGTTTLSSSFTIINPAPVLTNLAPNAGAREATLDVVITGENFIAGLTSVSFGNDITINSTTINSATQLTANITIGAAAALGARNVAVTNPAPGGGTATLVNSFTVSTILPAITSATPNSGNRLQTLDVVLTGDNFINGVTSVDFGGDITINTTTINSATQLTANITIAANAVLGARDIIVTNSGLGGGSATLANGFTVNNPAPILTSVNPTLGLQGQTLNVILTGDNFIDGVSSVSFGNEITINTTTVNSATQITANITIAANAASGSRDVSVTNAAPNGGTSTLAGGFTVGFSPITLTSINPVVGNRLQTLDVVMNGTNFLTGLTTASFGPDITVNSVTVNSATQLTANITITANAVTGARNVSVTNPDPGGSTATLTNSFIVNNPTPQLTELTPNSGGRGETLDIAMTGENFINGLTTASFGAGITVNSVTVSEATQMTVNVTIAANAALGARTVVVTNPAPGGGSVTFINGFTVANPAPALASIAPTSGLQGQTLNVVLNGSGFIDGLSVISFGDGITVNSTTVISNSQASANITIDANATVGTREVTVTNPAPGGGVATLNAAFTIGFNAPTLASLAPSIGARLQNMNVVLTGSNFINGVTTVDFGADVTINSVTANSATQLTANITIAANAALGSRNVSVTNPAPAGGTATLANSFTITNPAPVLTSVAPSTGERETTLEVIVTGNNFIDGLTSVDFGNGITINTTTINSATQLTANLTITPSAATGLRNVVVTNAAPGGGAATLVNNFTVTNATPTLASIAPAFVSRGQTVDVVFTGSHFYQDATSANLGNDITINSTTANSLTQLTVNITVGANAALGLRDVSVTNATPGGGTATLTSALTVGFPTITLTNATPNVGNRLQTLDVVLTGSNFIQGATSVTFGNDIAVNSTTVNSATQLTANITIAGNAVLGSRDITVTNPEPGGGGATLNARFTVNNPAPVLTSVNPTSGNRLQTLDVVLTGENFIDGVTSVSFGNDVTINTTTINSATQLTANISIAVNATLGLRDVIVTNVQGGSAVLTDGFTINNPAPVLTSVNPTLGLQGQTLNVILTGDNFIAGVSSVSLGEGITINTTTVNSATQLTANVSIAANATTGARDVVVTNIAPGGGNATLTSGFTVGLNAPTLTQVNPPLGSRYQTLDVLLTGSNFIAGVTTANFGEGITINNTTVNSASQLTANITITPLATLGARSVSVTNPEPGGATATLNNGFTVTNPTPALTNVTPNNGSRGQTLDVLLDGENFITGGTTVVFGSGITVNSVLVNTPQQMSVNISIADNAALGTRNIVVTNPAPGGGSVTFINGFTIANPAPVLTSIAPTSGLQNQTLNVVLNGEGFIAGLTTLSMGNDITINNTTVISTTQLSANLTISANAIIGTRDVSLTNAAPGGGTSTLAGAFTVGYNAPTLTTVSPNVGARLQTLNVVLTGTQFISGVTSVDFGGDITVNSVNVNSATQLTANLTIAVNAALGARDVIVMNPAPGGGSATLANGFIVNNPVPAITSVSPNAGNRQQTLDVLVNGSNFIEGVTSVSLGNDITINTTTINSATQLTANITIGLNAAVGPRSVLVTNAVPGGGTATFSNGFTVGVSSPVLTSIAPQSGTRFQTLDVVLNGSNFMSNVTTVSFGNDIVVNSVNVTSLAQLTANITINPNAVLGARDVTVTNPPPDGGSSTLAGAFTVTNPTPQLTNVAPALGSIGQTLQVVLSGNNFINGVSTANFGNDITINSTTVNSSGQMTVDITIAANAATGPRNVSVTNSAPGGGTATLENVFTVGIPAPTLTSLVPNTGNRLQTLEVTLFGTNFINGQTTVSFGNNINVNSITFTSSTQMTANLTIAVNAALGARNVTVSNPGPLGGTATLENGFTVGVAIPTLTSISPTFGNRGQTLNVVMLGSNFTGGVTSADFGSGITVNSVTVNSATQLTANITLAANAALGVRDVSVANPNPGGGTATLTNAFTVGIAIPTLASITPAQALRGQTLDVILTGSNFIVGVTTMDLGNDVTFNAINFNSTTEIAANITIGNGAAIGPRDVSVSNPGPGGGTATLTNGFTINVIGPTLTSIAPNSGNRGQTLDVIFNGTNFSAGVTTVSLGSDVTVNAVTVNSSTQLTANLTIAANAALGTRDVSVTNVGPGGGTATLPSAFTVGIAIPTLTSLTPNSGNRSQTLNVVMAGSNFSAGTTTVNFGDDIQVNSVNVNSATQLTTNISIGANAALGVREVSVTNTAPGGGTATLLNAFTVGGAVPTLLSIAPQGGNRGETFNVVLTGTNFANGLTTINLGNDITINSVAFNNGTQMTANITIAANAVLGPRNVSVSNPPPGGGTATLPNAFTVGSAIPTLTSINPTNGNRGQTLNVTLTGSNFSTGISSVSFGNEITINSTTINSATQITANITIAANATLGTRDVSVTNSGQGGGTATLPGAFTVGVAIPTLTSISPASGNRAQTLDVVFTGSNFTAGITSVSLGNDVTVNTTIINSSTQLTANIAIGANAALGARDVSVTNTGAGGGTATLPNAFTIGHALPSLASVNPAFANRGQNLDVTLSGNNFAPGFTTVSFGNDIMVNNVSVNSLTQMTVNISVGANAVLGVRDVAVTNPTPGGGTAILPNAFTVGVSIPTLTSLTPQSGIRGQTLNVTMTGTNFVSNVTTVSFGFDITINSVSVTSATELSANISIAPNAVLGSRDVSVTNAAPGGGTATLPNAFTVGIGAPTLTNISPTSGNRGQTQDVVLTGSNFAAGLTTVSLGNDITINSIIVNSSAQLTANVTIAVNAVLGSRNVSVSNPAPGGGTATMESAFTVGVAIPILTSLSPAFGNLGQTLEVTLNGANFAANLTTVNFGEGITINALNVISFSQMIANITIAPNAAVGSRDVSATNPSAGGGTVTLRNAFTVGVSQPTLTNVAPNVGTRGQSLDVILSGTNFTANVTTASFGNDVTVNNVTVTSGTQLTANITIAANAAFGSRDVSVTNPGAGGGTATLPNAFSVIGIAPTLVSLNPTSGNRGQTLEVQMLGSNFSAGVSSVSFGEGITINFINVISATQITANIFITQNAALGAREVSVTNSGPSGGTATLPNGFTVGVSQPTLASIAPQSGNRGQALNVIFNGSNFVSGATSVSLGEGITVNSVTVNNAAQLTAGVLIALNANLGAREVSVTTPGGTASLENAFIVNPITQGIVVTPSSGARGQTLEVVFSGPAFATNNTTVDFGNDVTVNSVTFNSATQITANISIAANASLGARDVSVTNPGPNGGTIILPNAFTITSGLPALLSIAPTSGNRGQVLDVIFTGSNFVSGITTASLGNDITVNSVTVTSSTQLTANVTISANAVLGVRDVSVTNSGPNGGTATLTNAFTVGISLPGLLSVQPAAGNRGQTLTLTLTGSNFSSGLTSVNLGADITINSTTVVSSTQMTVNITIGANAALGPRDVSVTNSGPGGGTATLPNAFNVGTSIPSVTSITPANAMRGQTLDVMVAGSNFIPNATTLNLGNEVTINTLVITSATQLTANITIAAKAVLGPRDVSVTNPPPGGGTGTLVNGFIIGGVPPTLTNVAPASGNRLQTLDVVLTGTNFLGGLTSVSFGNDITINSTTVNSSTQLTANITISASATTGARDVSVSNSGPGSGSAVLPNSFTVTTGAPTLATLLPTSGKRNETLNVTLTGTNFFSGISSVDFGSGITVLAITVQSQAQLTATIKIDSLAALGLRNVAVTNAAPGGGIAVLNNAFTVRAQGAAKFLISGFIRTAEGVGVSGVLLEGLPDNPMTDATGFYQGSVNPGFSGEVRPVKGGYSFAPASRSYNNVQADMLAQDYAALLEQKSFAYPAPFNPSLETVQIRFVFESASEATLKIMDAAGDVVHEVENPGGVGRTGEIIVSWDGRNGRGEMVANGIYFYVITTSSQERITGKIAVLR